VNYNTVLRPNIEFFDVGSKYSIIIVALRSPLGSSWPFIAYIRIHLHVVANDCWWSVLERLLFLNVQAVAPTPWAPGHVPTVPSPLLQTSGHGERRE